MLKPTILRMICTTLMASFACRAEAQALQQHVDVSLQLIEQYKPSPRDSHPQHLPPAVAWLKPVGSQALPFPGHDSYVLMQKNRMFTPHILVVPVGSVVLFPNADPFFHNVFSLFDGKRFDLGLYGAGSKKEVTFSREGLSYIFCNIHPEMSAVVLALSTPLFAVADAENGFVLRDVPPGDYNLHVWIEGAPPSFLEEQTRRVHLGSGMVDLGQIGAPMSEPGSVGHTNKFGKPYTPDPQGIY